MAVYNPGNQDSSSGYAQIINAQNNRANLELQRPQWTDVATKAVDEVDKILTAKREFAQQMQASGKIQFTQDMADQMTTETNKGLSPEGQISSKVFTPLIGTWQTPDSIHSWATQKTFDKTIAASKQYSDEQKALAQTPEGRKQLAEKVFTEKTNPVDSYEKALAKQYNDGKISLDEFASRMEKYKQSSTSKPSGGRGADAVDKKFASVYSDYVLSGGSADAAKQIQQLREVRDQLGKTSSATGPVVGNTPDFIKNFTNPQSVAMQEHVADVVQRTLRPILGSQFTEQEGKALIARAYNPKLQESENILRLNKLIGELENAASAKEDAATYFEDNGTLKGFKGKIYTSANEFLAKESAPVKILSVREKKK